MKTEEINQRLLSDHRRIEEIAERLKAILKGTPPSDMQELVSARWSFASALMQHLAVKERHIYAKLEQDSRTDVAVFSERSKSDLIRRFAAYTDHMQGWPTARALGDWPTYRIKAIAVVDAFLDRLKWEEGDLLTFVERHGIDIAIPAAVTSNWVRKAFDVKTSIEDHQISTR